MGFISSVVSAFSSAVSSVGSALGRAASWAGSALTSALSVGGGLLSGVARVGEGLLRAFGIFGHDDPPLKEWGDRMIQAEEQKIFPDQFENFDDYLDSLRNFELDPEKSKESSLDQKNFKGVELAGRALENKFSAPEGSMANLFLLNAANPEYFTSERFQNLLNSGMDIRAIADYFEGRLWGAEFLEIEDELVDLDQKLNPGKDEMSSREDLAKAADKIQNSLHNS